MFGETSARQWRISSIPQLINAIAPGLGGVRADRLLADHLVAGIVATTSLGSLPVDFYSSGASRRCLPLKLPDNCGLMSSHSERRAEMAMDIQKHRDREVQLFCAQLDVLGIHVTSRSGPAGKKKKKKKVESGCAESSVNQSNTSDNVLEEEEPKEPKKIYSWGQRRRSQLSEGAKTLLDAASSKMISALYLSPEVKTGLDAALHALAFVHCCDRYSAGHLITDGTRAKAFVHTDDPIWILDLDAVLAIHGVLLLCHHRTLLFTSEVDSATRFLQVLRTCRGVREAVSASELLENLKRKRILTNWGTTSAVLCALGVRVTYIFVMALSDIACPSISMGDSWHLIISIFENIGRPILRPKAKTGEAPGKRDSNFECTLPCCATHMWAVQPRRTYCSGHREIDRVRPVTNLPQGCKASKMGCLETECCYFSRVLESY